MPQNGNIRVHHRSSPANLEPVTLAQLLKANWPVMNGDECG
jgi:hypothetical protein